MKIIFVVLGLFNFISCVKQPLEFHRLFADKDTRQLIEEYGNKKSLYYFYFIVSGYKNSDIVEEAIDSFALKFAQQKEFADEPYAIHLSFFKETAKTNVREIDKWPRGLFLYSESHDLVYTYIINKQGVTRTKVKNGKAIETVPAIVNSKVRITVKKVTDSITAE